MKRSMMLSFLGVAMAFTAVLGTPRAAMAAAVTTDPADTAVTSCDEFVVRATLDAFPNMKAASLSYQYDPAKLQFVSATAGDVFTSAGPYVDFVTPPVPVNGFTYDITALTNKANGRGSSLTSGSARYRPARP